MVLRTLIVPRFYSNPASRPGFLSRTLRSFIMIKISMIRIMMMVAAAVMFLSCASTPDKNEKNAEKSAVETSTALSEVDQTQPELRTQINYSSLSPEQEGSELTITGLFSKGADGSAALITNPESRSRVTFVLADPQGVLEAAALEDGSMITVTGILTEASATWRKHLDVITVN